jgi:predicted deacylase
MTGPKGVADIAIASSSRCEEWLEVFELIDGSPLKIPVIVVNGSRKGPVVYIGAGVHGDEINGVNSVIRALNEVDAAKLTGKIIAVPVQNPLAFRNRERLITLNQFDEQDLGNAFPGDVKGSPCSIMANFLFTKVVLEGGADYVVDIHSGFIGSCCYPHAFVPPRGFGQLSETARELAECLNFGFVVQEIDTSFYAKSGMLHMAVAKKGIPGLGAELGRGLFSEKGIVEVGSQGILNMLGFLGMIGAGPANETERQPIIQKVSHIRSKRGGLFFQEVEAGDYVKRGTVIATITDVFGKAVEQAVSPIEGYILVLNAFPMIHEGERIAKIGVV